MKGTAVMGKDQMVSGECEMNKRNVRGIGGM